MKRSVHMKVPLPYKPELVWQALTDAKLLGKWFMENDLVPQPGHEFTFRMAPQRGWDGITWCRVTEVQPLHSIEYTYRGEATGEKTLACAGVRSETAKKVAKSMFTRLDTVVRFTITPAVDGTLLELKHSGFTGFKLVLISFVFGMGWKKQLKKKLRAVLEKMSM